MSVKLLEKEKILAPFLSSPLHYIPGQDPLGLLNVGERTFSTLLPGLNNVTNRIRYYSFYCWFFHIYAREISIPGKKEQFKYLRRAEFILALLAAKTQVQGIAGITKAAEMYSDEINTFSLAEGTGEGQKYFDGTYWKNRRGIFGQNYVSSLNQMGIIREYDDNAGIFVRTEFEIDDRISGRQLALAFEENIGKTASAIFISALKTGEVDQTQLTKLILAFNMLDVPFPSNEHNLLWNLLVGPDEPKNNDVAKLRRRTIQLILEQNATSKTNFQYLDFTTTAYHKKGQIGDMLDETLSLWYYYQLDQFWHIISTGTLSAFLEILENKTGGSWVIEYNIIQEIANDVEMVLIDLDFTTKNGSFDDLKLMEDQEEDIVNDMKSRDTESAIAYAMLLLKKLVHVNKEKVEFLIDLGNKHQLNSQSNFVYSTKDLMKHIELPLKDFIAYFIKKYVVIRHQWVALRKMTENQSTEKFIREDGLIRYIEWVDYGYSSPRLNTLLSFFSDLQLRDQVSGSITATGTRMLKSFEL